MATIKDVAKRAGVSISTVSRVVNGAPNVDKALADAVNMAIKELDYQPNFAARTMKKHNTETIGFVMPDFSTPFFEGVIKMIEKEFRGRLLVLFVNTYDDPETEKMGIMHMVARQVDVLVISSTGHNEEFLYQLYQKGQHIIFVDRHPIYRKMPSVLVDKRDGIVKALNYFKSIGHRRISIVTGPKEFASNIDRTKGLGEFLEENPDFQNSVEIHFGNFTEDYGFIMAEKLLSLPEPPTAIITGSIVIASGILLYCKRKNIAIPGDVSIISTGDFSQGELISPRLSYIVDEHERIARIVTMMIKDIFNNRLENDSILLPSRLCISESVQPLIAK